MPDTTPGSNSNYGDPNTQLAKDYCKADHDLRMFVVRSISWLTIAFGGASFIVVETATIKGKEIPTSVIPIAVAMSGTIGTLIGGLIGFLIRPGMPTQSTPPGPGGVNIESSETTTVNTKPNGSKDVETTPPEDTPTAESENKGGTD